MTRLIPSTPSGVSDHSNCGDLSTRGVAAGEDPIRRLAVLSRPLLRLPDETGHTLVGSRARVEVHVEETPNGLRRRLELIELRPVAEIEESIHLWQVPVEASGKFRFGDARGAHRPIELNLRAHQR